MTVSDDKVRTLLTLSKDAKKRLEELAKADNRSFNNFVVTILYNYIKEHED